MRILFLGAWLLAMALGCSGDHVVGTTSSQPDASPVDARGSDARNDAGSTDAGACGDRRQPCCQMGMECMAGLSCDNGVCR